MKLEHTISRSKRLLLTWPLLLILITLHGGLASQAQSALVDSTPSGPMSGFELYQSGLFWWNSGYRGDEVIPAADGLIGLKASRGGYFVYLRGTGTHFPVRDTRLLVPYQSVARTDRYLFFYGDSQGKRIFRRELFGPGQSDFGVDFSGLSYDYVGAMIVANNRLYWSVIQGNDGQVRSKDINGGPGGGDQILIQNIGLVTKMAMIGVVDEAGNFTETRLLMLTQGGQLYMHRFLLFLPTPGTRTTTLLASNVTDFAVRNESQLMPSGILFRQVNSTKVYATTGVVIGNDRVAGQITVYDLTNGGSYVDYQTGDPNLQLTGIAMDDDRIFITRTPLRLGSGIFANDYDRANSQILRKFSPARGGLIFAGNYDTIATAQEGRNLRSDGQSLYYINFDQLRRIKTDAPPVELNYRAVGLEAVQAVQDFNNSVPLIAGKPALVRGYAQRTVNTTGRNRFPLSAWLRAFRNGVELPDSPVHLHETPIIDNAADLATLRASLDRSFNFDMPPSWLATPGALRLEFTVNPTTTAPETGAAPLADNSVSAEVNILQGREPTLVFKTMSSTFPNYDMNAPNSGFWDIVDRARGLMPVSNFKVRVSPGSVTKPVFTLLGIKSRSFDMPDDKTWALIWMTMAHAFSSDPGPDTHWVGMFPREVNFNGIAGAKGVRLSDYIDVGVDFTIPLGPLENTAVVRMEAFNTAPSTAPWSSVRGGFALAHELGHNYGRFHINQRLSPGSCGAGAPEGPWHVFPGDPCTLGVADLNNPAAPVGYDARTYSLILPNMAGDLMSYADLRWVSPFTWNEMIKAIPATGFNRVGLQNHRGSFAPQMLQPHPPLLVIQGLLQPEFGQAVLLPALDLPEGTLDPVKAQGLLDAAAALPANASYRVRLLGAANEPPLDDRPLLILPTGDGEKSLAFMQAIPRVPGVAKIQIVGDGKVLAELETSAVGPQLVLGPPGLDQAQSLLTLDWTASDADGDALFFTVQFSADNGSTWETLRVNDAATTLSIATDLLTGGSQCRLRVIATDGFHTSTALSEPFALANRPPLITISGIRESEQFVFGEELALSVQAYDPEDGALDPGAVQWSISGPENRSGRGPSAIASLPPGSYSLSVSATDEAGNVATRTIPFQVRPLIVPEATGAVVVDGICDDDAFNQAALIPLRVNTGNVPESVACVVRAHGAIYVCFSNLGYSTVPGELASVGINFDTDGSGDAAAQSGDIGFGINQDGIPSQVIGNGAAMVGQTSLSPGFESGILLAEHSWSAELRVPEELLGGWNHDAGIMLVHYFPNAAGQAKIWPPGANVNQPSSWAEGNLGALPVLANRAPVAVASAPSVFYLTEQEPVGLDGSASYDLDGDPLSFAWTQTAGPAVTLSDATGASPNFTAPQVNEPTTLSFQLLVSDGKESSQPASISVRLVPDITPPPVPTGTVGTEISNGAAAGRLISTAGPGQMAIIEASSDLVHWAPIATNSVGFLQTVAFKDAEASQFQHRFYRAVEAGETPSASAAGSALGFTGQSELVVVPHEEALNAFPLTVAFWVKTSDTGEHARGLVSKYEDASFNGYSVFLANGRLQAWYLRSGSDTVLMNHPTVDAGFIANGEWHHIVLAVDEGGGRIYVDGQLRTALPWSGIPGACSTPEPLQFGRYYNYPNSLTGELDEISLWNRALSETEIRSLIRHQLNGAESDLLGYWRFDEGSGEMTNDASNNGHTGVLQNAPTRHQSTAPIFP